MCEIFDIVCDALFEAVYICCWFSFLSTIFYNVYIKSLKYREYLLYREIYHNRKLNNNDTIIRDDEIILKLTNIQHTVQKIEDKIYNLEINSTNDIVDECSFESNINIKLPPQTHITFPHFLIISTNICKDPTICLLSASLSNILGLDLGTCLSIESVINRFINYIENNKLVKDDILILNLNLKQLFGIDSIDTKNYKLKLSECETYLKPHLKNIHR
jgi:hypothetical protein